MLEGIRHRITALLVLFVLTGCRSASTIKVPTVTVFQPTTTHTVTPSSVVMPPTATLTSSPTPFIPSPTPIQKLSGPYLGQDPPGMEPELFAPDFVSNPDSHEYSGSFSPDGSEYYFYRFSDDSPARLFISKQEDGLWTLPEEPGFSAGMTAFEPYVTADNRRLYFATLDYPVPSSHPSGLPAYVFVDRTQNRWTEPQYAGQGMFISSSLDGQMYTTDMSTRNRDGKTYLAEVSVTDGRFMEYEPLAIKPHWGRQAHPCIALDGSYILFDVEEGRHLFLSFKKADGSWGEAIDMTQHGFDPMAGGAYISPDGKYLFFALRGDIWWVDVRVIENLRPVE